MYTVCTNNKLCGLRYSHALSQCSAPTHLRDAQPFVVVAVEAKLDVFRFIGVEVEVLVSKGVAARRDFDVVVAVIVHVQRSGPLISQMESDAHPNDVLGFLEGVLDAAIVSLARPARVGRATAVPSVFRHAAVRVTASIVGITIVVIGGIYVDPRSHACVNETLGVALFGDD